MKFSAILSRPTSLYKISAKCLTLISPLNCLSVVSAKIPLISSFLASFSNNKSLHSRKEPKHPLHSVMMSAPISSAIAMLRAAIVAQVVWSKDPNTPGAGQQEAPSMSFNSMSNLSNNILVAFSIPG